MRGRKPIPPEIQLLKGNPSKRRAAALELAAGRSPEDVAPPPPAVSPRLTAPEWLDAREAATFATIVAHLPSARASDTNAIARYSTWLQIFIETKQALDQLGAHYETEGRGGSKMVRPHPLARRLAEAEGKLSQLEHQLLLTPKARQAAAVALIANPPPPPFAEDTQAQDNESPIGWLNRQGKAPN